MVALIIVVVCGAVKTNSTLPFESVVSVAVEKFPPLSDDAATATPEIGAES